MNATEPKTCDLCESTPQYEINIPWKAIIYTVIAVAVLVLFILLGRYVDTRCAWGCLGALVPLYLGYREYNEARASWGKAEFDHAEKLAGVNPKKAYEWMLEAARHYHPPAQFIVGRRIYNKALNAFNSKFSTHRMNLGKDIIKYAAKQGVKAADEYVKADFPDDEDEVIFKEMEGNDETTRINNFIVKMDKANWLGWKWFGIEVF